MLCSIVAEASRLPATAPMAFRKACSSAAHSLVRLLGHTRPPWPTVQRPSTPQARVPGAPPYKLTLPSAQTDLLECTGPSAAAIRSATRLPRQALSHCSELDWLAWLEQFAERNYSREDPRRRCDGAHGNCCFLRVESGGDHLRPRRNIPQASPACKPSRSASPDELICPRLSAAKEVSHDPPAYSKNKAPHSQRLSSVPRSPHRPNAAGRTCDSAESCALY